ncbi:WD40-repeat-containing domain protein [Roridomyces roridus]|uniref:WD40-repeat-containing domain protein n=1 Tax=Roridomyces roridus TaxID=1738132 RepID=A0AAD7FQP7_9AGAR|nr:WD40-repeat-containing domain protein [Roridomyces roridus]
MEELLNLPTYALTKTLLTPSPVSSLALDHAGHLFVGSDDGSLRLYDLLSFKVLRAISGLPAEISSIACFKRAGSDLRDVWLASGHQAYLFRMDSQKLVQTTSDAISRIELCEKDDVLNELALNASKSHLAFSTDLGSVGVVDLAASPAAVSTMKTSHSSICGIVRFIPDRPREIVSGGYDSCLLHFDFMQRTVLSRREIREFAPPFPATDGMSLSPPFVMSAAMTPTGLMAAGTADGRLWLGSGGEKTPSSTKKKRSRKWEGLDEEGEVMEKIAEGPIVAMAFRDPSILTLSTLLGNIMQFRIVRQNDSVQLMKIWEGQTDTINKVNSLVADEKRIAIAGLTADAKGATEIWDLAKNT